MEPAFVRNAKLMVIVLVSTVGLASCDLFTSPVEVHVRTDATQYPPSGSLGKQSVVVTGTLVNNDTKSVWLTFCGGIVQKEFGGRWVNVWQMNCAAIDGVDTEVKPQETIPLRFELVEPGQGLVDPFAFDVCHPHRLVVGLSDDGKYTGKTKIILAASNSFGFGGFCN